MARYILAKRTNVVCDLKLMNYNLSKENETVLKTFYISRVLEENMSRKKHEREKRSCDYFFCCVLFFTLSFVFLMHAKLFCSQIIARQTQKLKKREILNRF